MVFTIEYIFLYKFEVNLSIITIYCSLPHITEWYQSSEHGLLLVKTKLEYALHEHS